VGEKSALRIEQSAFADGHLPTDMQRLALPADDPGIGGHRSCEVYLVFERDRREAWLERSYDGCSLVFLSRFGSLARALIKRRAHVSVNVLQNLVRKRWRSLRDRP